MSSSPKLSFLHNISFWQNIILKPITDYHFLTFLLNILGLWNGQCLDFTPQCNNIRNHTIKKRYKYLSPTDLEVSGIWILNLYRSNN